ncbi:MarR family winged helix-turn-helix transcriptional regulator [Cellulomonas sp. Root137]|uniref:MarR family winged helix-turn-helix transcriptional regulator n=1 Tax=Cellulomonas sp. Root137 TaxID=1736459 RepID=UPI0006F215DA|nr:MarR family transcriptional regulator [Cellulomonas sp. Root137]KQY46397.1 hypothetical protein ASD18_02830 [Cellulomonas sp. Root137]
MDFFDALVRYETELWNHLDERLGDAEAVSLATLSALRVVGRHPQDCRVHEIRTELAITVGAASKLVDRLERDGWAVRSANPGDRRSSFVALTPAGSDALAAGSALLERELREQLGDEPGVADATAVLLRLRSRLGVR